jgi:rusticyanin
MTVTVRPADIGAIPKPPRRAGRIAAIVVAAAVAVAAAVGIGIAVSGRGSTTQSSYSYYQSVMSRLGLGRGSMMGGSGSMMGGSGYGWLMGRSGYAWMMGGRAAPGWMMGDSLPGFMMGSSSDPGQVMGQMFADAPGPRISASEATTLAVQVPAGAGVDRSANRIIFAGRRVSFTVVASPAGGPDETFRIAGLVNPTVVVPRGAHVAIQLVNADPDTAHGLVLAASGTASPWMPMTTARPAFAGAAVWFLGDSTSAEMHRATLSFTVGAQSTYQYLCPVPGHARKGMVGTLVVS